MSLSGNWSTDIFKKRLEICCPLCRRGMFLLLSSRVPLLLPRFTRSGRYCTKQMTLEAPSLISSVITSRNTKSSHALLKERHKTQQVLDENRKIVTKSRNPIKAFKFLKELVKHPLKSRTGAKSSAVLASFSSRINVNDGSRSKCRELIQRALNTPFPPKRMTISKMLMWLELKLKKWSSNLHLEKKRNVIKGKLHLKSLISETTETLHWDTKPWLDNWLLLYWLEWMPLKWLQIK